MKRLPKLRCGFGIVCKCIGLLHGDIGDHASAKDEGGPDQANRAGESCGIGHRCGDPAVECYDQQHQRQCVDHIDRGVPSDQHAGLLCDKGHDGGGVDLACAEPERGKQGKDQGKADEISCGAGEGGEATEGAKGHGQCPLEWFAASAASVSKWSCR